MCGGVEEIECGEPEQPLNAFFRSPQRNVQFDYECTLGYVLDGASNRYCQPNGQWSGQQPVCNGKMIGN